MQQLLLELLPPPAASFDNFVVGKNAASVHALKNWLGDPKGSTCFLLWGEAASGRGHLLAASGARPLETTQGQLDDLADGSLYCQRQIDTLDESGQIALFNAFNRLKLGGGKLLVSSTEPPAALNNPSFREDLRTRLGSGLVYRLWPLSDEEKRAALIDRAKARGLTLSDEIIDYLFRHAKRDMGTLSALIDALDRFSLQHKRPLTLPLLRNLLQTSLDFSPT